MIWLGELAHRSNVARGLVAADLGDSHLKQALPYTVWHLQCHPSYFEE